MENFTTLSPPDAATYYHLIEVSVIVIITLILLPMNGFIIWTFCRPSMIKRPVNWLFIYLSIWDIIGLFVQIAWNAKEYFASDPQKMWCSGPDLALRIVEKLTECIPAYTTAAIAILRAVAIWRSSRNKKTDSSKLVIVSICILIFIVSGLLCPSLIAVNCIYPGTQKCATSLNPLYGIAELTHAVIQIVLINGTVLVCYTYICIVLFLNNRLFSDCGLYAQNRPHRRTLIILIIYTVLYTVMTVPMHANELVTNDCFTETDNENKEFIIGDVLDSIWQVGFAGLNPVMLYACNKDFRKSISVMYIQFKRCDLDVYRADQREAENGDSEL